jgi:hypothetical protein
LKAAWKLNPFDLVAAGTFATLARPGHLGPTRSWSRQFGVSAESLMHNEKKWDNASLEPRNRIDLWSNE